MELTIKQAITAHSEGKFEEAKKIYQKILETNPNMHEIHNNLGLVLFKLGKLSEAETSLRKAISIKPDYAEAYYNFGTILLKLNKLDQAENCFKKAISIKPDYINSIVNLAETLFKLDSFNEAEELFKKVIKLQPSNSLSYSRLGIIYFNSGKLNDAEIFFKEAIKLSPNYAKAYCDLGILQKEMSKIEEAKSNLLNAINLKKNYKEAHYSLAILYHEQSYFENAFEHFILADDYLDSQNYVLRNYYTKNKKDNFYKLLDKMINQGSNNAVIGSLMMSSEIKYGIKNKNIFCNNPMKYVLVKDLIKEYDFKKIFVETAKNILKNNIYRNQPLLINGQQSSGNLFDLQNDVIKKIKNIILLEVEKYRKQFSDSNEGFLKNWPTNFELNGWFITMKSGGSLKSHMHETGWLSGSVYINIPKNIEKNSGNLVLSTGIKSQEKIINLNTGTLCLFPASLHHSTIPFESEEDRIVLAFDVNPKK